MTPFVSAVHKMRPFLRICLMRLVQSFELLLGCVEPSSVIDHGTFLVRLARNNVMDGSSKIRCGATNISCGRQIEPSWRRFEMRLVAIHGRSVCWHSECCLSEGIFQCVFLSYDGLGEFLCPFGIIRLLSRRSIKGSSVVDLTTCIFHLASSGIVCLNVMKREESSSLLSRACSFEV
jgi:hypothetical protein